MEIHDTDKVTVSYVAGGKTYSTTFQVGEKTLQDIFQAAEDANTKDTIFANKANKSVVASGLTTGAHDETVLNNATTIKLFFILFFSSLLILFLSFD